MNKILQNFFPEKNQRVVITGMGVISPVGLNRQDFWKALKAGEHGVKPLELANVNSDKVKVAAQVLNFNPTDYMDRKEARRMDRYCQFAVAATKEALEMSKLDMEAVAPFRSGVIIGSGVGGLETMQNQYEELLLKGGTDRVSPLFIPMMISNMAAGKVSINSNFKGSNFCVTTACASGTHSIGEAFRKIKHGYLDVVIAGGAEAPITPIALGGFANMKALNLTSNPDEASLPFDQRRGGFVIAEGGGILILESLDHALARKAEIWGEIIGYGDTADAYHITSPDPDGLGASMAMRLAMAEAGITCEQVDYINAHGTGTDLNDKYETGAIKNALGEAAKTVSISSTKGSTGHLLGAAGAVEAIASIMAIKEGIVPPTANLFQPDPECDLHYTPLKAQAKNIDIALSNSFGFGGQNATLLFKKY